MLVPQPSTKTLHLSAKPDLTFELPRSDESQGVKVSWLSSSHDSMRKALRCSHFRYLQASQRPSQTVELRTIQTSASRQAKEGLTSRGSAAFSLYRAVQ